MIPNVIYFNNHLSFEYLHPLMQKNVMNTIRIMQPDYYEFWDDFKCIQNIPVKLQFFYHTEKMGMRKSDMCRLVQLRKGGYYFDNDIVLLQKVNFKNFETVLGNDIGPPSFFQAFIAMTPNNPIIDLALNLTFDRYVKNNIPENLGTIVLYDACRLLKCSNMTLKEYAIRRLPAQISLPRYLKKEVIFKNKNCDFVVAENFNVIFLSRLMYRGKMCIHHPYNLFKSLRYNQNYNFLQKNFD